jgi:hypothetical protein
MAVRLSALRAGRPLPSRKIPGSHFWIIPRFIVRLEGLGQLNNPVIPLGFDTATFILYHLSIYLSICLSIYASTALSFDLGLFFCFLIFLHSRYDSLGGGSACTNKVGTFSHIKTYFILLIACVAYSSNLKIEKMLLSETWVDLTTLLTEFKHQKMIPFTGTAVRTSSPKCRELCLRKLLAKLTDRAVYSIVIYLNSSQINALCKSTYSFNTSDSYMSF